MCLNGLELPLHFLASASHLYPSWCFVSHPLELTCFVGRALSTWRGILNSLFSTATMWSRLSLLAALPAVLAQFPPAPEGITTLKSKFLDGVSISFKEVCGKFLYIQNVPARRIDFIKAEYLRNHSRREVVLRLCASAATLAQ